MSAKITSEHLSRSAMVYVRQSTSLQVAHNRESQRRQYALKDRASELGFKDVVVIDEDLGRSAGGQVERPGFERLVAVVCAQGVGAIFCIEASRLARNGRDWHHLLELCGLTRTLIVDPDGIYDPTRSNDRLLLGLKGTMSEFELTLLRQRSMEAIRAKAQRGELKFALPIGLCWTPQESIELDPDRRIQEALRLVFRKFRDLGSARQVLLWLRDQELTLPAVVYGEGGREIRWKLPVYNTIHGIITNPLYAGAYAYGRTGTRVTLEGDRARKTQGHAKPREEWLVLIHDHHPGYTSWDEFDRNQRILLDNAHMKSRMGRKSARGGRGLLAGLLRCRRCGRMLHVEYSGRQGCTPRYSCRGAQLNHGVGRCISFGGLRPERAIAEELYRVVEGPALEAAMGAAERVRQQQEEQRKAMGLELDQARYAARLAARQYEAVDPDNRLAELEARWNGALQRVQRIEDQRHEVTSATEVEVPDLSMLTRLAADLPAVWNDSSTPTGLKQRIVRILIREIVADVDESRAEIVLVIHWAGGRHSELRVAKNKVGHHGRATEDSTVEIVRRMAGRWPDEQIAAILNRLGRKTGAGNTWTEGRVSSLRHYQGLPAYDPSRSDPNLLTMDQAARRLGVSPWAIRRLIQADMLPATQAVFGAPWEIQAAALQTDAVQEALEMANSRAKGPRCESDTGETPMIPGFGEVVHNVT